MMKELPVPAFRRFERVLLKGERPHTRELRGERGTVISLDSFAVRQKPPRTGHWQYVVHLPGRNCWKALRESDLTSEGYFDEPAAHRGSRAEVSFDLVFEEGMDWMEGSYRLPGEFWKVVIFQKNDVPDIRHRPQIWRKPTRWEEVTDGIVFELPRDACVDREYLLRAMSLAFGYNDWTGVRGPDSMALR